MVALYKTFYVAQCVVSRLSNYSNYLEELMSTHQMNGSAVTSVLEFVRDEIYNFQMKCNVDFGI